MENVITSSKRIDRWIARPMRPEGRDECLREEKQFREFACKDKCIPFSHSAEKGVSPRAYRKVYRKTAQQWRAKTQFEDAIVRGLATPARVLSTEARFYKLADQWSEKTMHISSVSDLINDTFYQQIIDLGWEALPYILEDLRKNRRFWFPALAAITGVRPFDPGDLSNPRRMTEAWVKWGKRKGLIG